MTTDTLSSTPSDAVALDPELVGEFEELSAKDRNVALAGAIASARTALAEALASGSPVTVRRATRRLDDAQAALWQANLGLADKWAGRFRRQGDLQTALEYRDAAREGLWEAIASWDPAKGGSLATWAWPRIKKALFAEVVSNEHHMSTHAFQFRPRIIAAVETLRAAGAEVTDEAISAIASVPLPMVARIRQADAAGSALSLDAPMGADGDGSALSEILVFDAYEADAAEYTLEDLARLTAGANLVDLWVGLRYHGADGGPPETLAVIGATLGRSREMARKAFNRFKAAVEATAAGVAPDAEASLGGSDDEADARDQRGGVVDETARAEALGSAVQVGLFG